jgi:hypothetical protein
LLASWTDEKLRRPVVDAWLVSVRPHRGDRLTTTLITKLLTNPLAPSRSTANAVNNRQSQGRPRHRPTVDGMEAVEVNQISWLTTPVEQDYGLKVFRR